MSIEAAAGASPAARPPHPDALFATVAQRHLSLDNGHSVESVLNDPYADPEWTDERTTLREERQQPVSEAELPAVTALLLLLDVQAEAAKPRPAISPEMDVLLGVKGVGGLLLSNAGLDPEGFGSHFELMAIATTSFVLGCQRNDTDDFPAHPASVKILLPRYRSSRAIARRLADIGRCRRELGSGRSLPTVVRATERAVVFDRVYGRSLSSAYGIDGPGDRVNDRLTLAIGVLAALVPTLDELRCKHQLHGGINPDTVVALNEVNQRPDLVLLDYGYTWATQSVVPATLRWRAWALFLAPELRNGGRLTDDTRAGVLEPVSAPDDGGRVDASWRADAYSVAVLLLWILYEPMFSPPAGQQRNDESGDTWVPEVDVINEALARLWDDAPGLARILDQLVTADPDVRSRALRGIDPYRHLLAMLGTEVRLTRMFRQVSEDGSAGFRQLNGVDLVNLRSLGSAMWLWRAGRRALRLEQDARRSEPRLLLLLDRLAGRKPLEGARTGLELAELEAIQDVRRARWLGTTALLLWTMCFLGFLYLTALDLGLNVPNVIAGLKNAGAGHVFPYQQGPSEVTNNLFGRLIGITFAMSGVTYVFNLYAPFNPMRTTWRFRRWLNASIWISTVVLPGVLPALAIWIYPAGAFFYSGIGMLFVAITNYWTLEFLRAGLVTKDQPERLAHVTLLKSDLEAINPYAAWRRTAAFFGVALIGLGALFAWWHPSHFFFNAVALLVSIAAMLSLVTYTSGRWAGFLPYDQDYPKLLRPRLQRARAFLTVPITKQGRKAERLARSS